MSDQLIEGSDIPPLPEGTVILGAIVLVKALDEDGDTSWYSRYTPSLTSIECLGMLHAEREKMTGQVLDAFDPDEPDED